MTDINYIAARLTGDGTMEILETELPVNVTAVNRKLSAPPTLEGSIEYEVTRLKKDGQLIFQPYNTAILVEQDGLLRGGGIYRLPRFRGDEWNLDVAGFTSYAEGTPYTGSTYFVQKDPLDIFRHIWAHIQEKPHGDVGVRISPLQSKVRVGTELEEVKFQAETSPGVRETVSFEAGPRKLTWYDTHDLGKEIDDYARETPFDWVEQVSWRGTSEEVDIFVDLGQPKIGTIRNDVTGIVYGANCETPPDVTGGELADEIIVIGAGEGRAAIRGGAGRTAERLRRTKVVVDKSIKSKSAANQRAKNELARTTGALVVEQLVVHDHPNLRLDAIKLGDSYPLYADLPWAGVLDTRVRVIGRSDVPGASDTATLTVVREFVA